MCFESFKTAKPYISSVFSIPKTAKIPEIIFTAFLGPVSLTPDDEWYLGYTFPGYIRGQGLFGWAKSAFLFPQ